MNKKLILALVTLLGFSTACSSVKNAPKDGQKGDSAQATDQTGKPLRRIVVMYGVRPPMGIRSEKFVEQIDTLSKQDSPASHLNPVSERPDKSEIIPTPIKK